MYYFNKLKPDTNFTGVLLPILILVILFAFAVLFIGIKAGLLVLFLFFLFYSLFSLTIYLRTRNIAYLAASLMQICFAFYFATLPRGILPLPDKKMALFLYCCALIIGIWLIFLVITRKAKWKGREVFELAAHETVLSKDGFTNRPRPAGKTDYTRDDLLGFAEYLSRNLIAMPYTEENRIIFSFIKMGDEFSFMFNPTRFRLERSWISFDYQGNVTVNISKKDYLDYREELSFDQLCENLGKIFISFMEYYRKGEEDRIVYKLNETGVGFFS